MRLTGDALVLIINGDTKPIEEAYEPEHLPGDSSWRALKCGNRHGYLPRAAINLPLDDMLRGLQSTAGGPNGDRVSASGCIRSPIRWPRA
jgi:hypothetical protein